MKRASPLVRAFALIISYTLVFPAHLIARDFQFKVPSDFDPPYRLEKRAKSILKKDGIGEKKLSSHLSRKVDFEDYQHGETIDSILKKDREKPSNVFLASNMANECETRKVKECGDLLLKSMTDTTQALSTFNNDVQKDFFLQKKETEDSWNVVADTQDELEEYLKEKGIDLKKNPDDVFRDRTHPDSQDKKKYKSRTQLTEELVASLDIVLAYGEDPTEITDMLVKLNPSAASGVSCLLGFVAEKNGSPPSMKNALLSGNDVFADLDDQRNVFSNPLQEEFVGPISGKVYGKRTDEKDQNSIVVLGLGLLASLTAAVMEFSRREGVREDREAADRRAREDRIAVDRRAAEAKKDALFIAAEARKDALFIAAEARKDALFIAAEARKAADRRAELHRQTIIELHKDRMAREEKKEKNIQNVTHKYMNAGLPTKYEKIASSVGVPRYDPNITLAEEKIDKKRLFYIKSLKEEVATDKKDLAKAMNKTCLITIRSQE